MILIQKQAPVFHKVTNQSGLGAIDLRLVAQAFSPPYLRGDGAESARGDSGAMSCTHATYSEISIQCIKKYPIYGKTLLLKRLGELPGSV